MRPAHDRRLVSTSILQNDGAFASAHQVETEGKNLAEEKYLILGDGIRLSPATNYTRAEVCAVNPTGAANLFISQMAQNR
jgi:hypothetical protein